jgi:hypothetical protein
MEADAAWLAADPGRTFFAFVLARPLRRACPELLNTCIRLRLPPVCGFHTRGALLYSCDTLNRGVATSAKQIRGTGPSHETGAPTLQRPRGAPAPACRLLGSKTCHTYSSCPKQAVAQRGKRGGHGGTVVNVQVRHNGQVSPSAKAQKARLLPTIPRPLALNWRRWSMTTLRTGLCSLSTKQCGGGIN